ncbi:MAG TPA: hypothetical protein VGP04_09160 [Pseudonocardiaceae bacterium]|jgi:hypothetical protein|nr:hypothetical protein [Pseudonocardiaceae bacterium]
MRYQLSAMVSTPQALEPICAQHRCAQLVPLATANLVLTPVTEDLVHELDRQGTRVSPETGFWWLSIGVQELLVTGSARGRIAYLEADYFGREGRQTAAVWQFGGTIYGPRILGRNECFPAGGNSPICGALRQLGVVAAGRRDEFVVAGLGRYRHTVEWSGP